MREHKALTIVGFAMILFLGGLFGYQKFFNDPTHVTNFTSYGDKKKDDKAVKKVVKESDVKDLPYAEEIIKLVNDSKKDEENDELSPYQIISKEYSKDIAELYSYGLLPSSQLSDKENKLIIMNGNEILKEDSNFYGSKSLVSTKEYMSSLGSVKSNYDINPNYRQTLTPSFNVEFSNTVNVAETKNINYKGFTISTLSKDSEETDIYYNVANQYEEQGKVDENNYVEFMDNTRVLQVRYVLKEDMKVSDIQKNLYSIKLNDIELEPLNVSKYIDGEGFDDSVSKLNGIELVKGKDYELKQYSIFTQYFIINKDATLYSDSNYVTIGDEKIELKKDTLDTFDDYSLYDLIEF